MDKTPLGLDEKTTCILSWLLQLFLGFVAPLVVFLACPNNPWARRQAAMGLTLNILTFFLGLLGGVLSLVGVGLIVLVLIGPLTLAVIVWGTVESAQGRDFSPPVLTDLCRKIFSV